MAHLRVHLGGSGHRLCDLGPELFPIPFAQAMDRDFHSAFRKAQRRSQVRIRTGVRRRSEAAFEGFKNHSAAVALIFRAQIAQGAVQQGERPVLVERFLRSAVARRAEEAGLGILQSQMRPAGPALLGLGALPLPGQKSLEHHKQEGPEPSARGIRLGDPISRQEPREELLRQILGIVRRAALAAYEMVNRIPIRLAELLQSGSRTSGFPARRQDQRPARRGENGLAAGKAGVGRVGHHDIFRKIAAKVTANCVLSGLLNRHNASTNVLAMRSHPDLTRDQGLTRCHALRPGLLLPGVLPRWKTQPIRLMSETNTEKNAATKKLESSAEHAKKALDAAAEASKAVGETVKKHAQSAYETGREHLSAAAKDVSEAASAKYQEIRGQAQNLAEDYKGRAKHVYSDATAKAQSFQSDTESYIRENPLKAVGIAVGIGFVLGVIFRR
jgi:ElaB/YqjD/DUF883 family membrane-anchored ribosome-binding protein